jgi:hypothetical protein
VRVALRRVSPLIGCQGTAVSGRRILERTARGRADAKAKGVKFGRKPKLTAHQQQSG